MASPITWKNISQPNFGASNVLAMAASKQLSDSFESGSQRLINQGEFNEKQNTDELIGKIGAYKNYDALSAAKADIFGGMEGQNIDERAISDYFGSQQNALGERETFNIGRKDRTDTEAANAFARDLMNSGVTNQREVQSRVMEEGLKQGWSDTTQGNVFSSINRDYQPTIQEAATAAAGVSALDHQRDVALQAQKDAADEVRERIKAGKATGKNADLVDGAKLPWYLQVLPGNGDEWAQRNATAFLGKATTQVGPKKAKEIFSKYTDGGVTKFGPANEELEQVRVANIQSDEYNGLTEFQKTLQAQSLSAQSEGALTEKQARKMLDDRFNAK